MPSFLDDNPGVYEIRHYLTSDDVDAFEDWIQRLRDPRALMPIDRRIYRLQTGNFGDHKFCRDGVWKLRIDVGQGYRVDYAIVGEQIVLLLCGGDKRTQDADIRRACQYWQEWQSRKP